jgi:hypothetical protein
MIVIVISPTSWFGVRSPATVPDSGELALAPETLQRTIQPQEIANLSPHLIPRETFVWHLHPAAVTEPFVREQRSPSHIRQPCRETRLTHRGRASPEITRHAPSAVSHACGDEMHGRFDSCIEYAPNAGILPLLRQVQGRVDDTSAEPIDLFSPS